MYDPLQQPALFALFALALPAALAGLVLLAARKLRARAELGWLGALAFGLAYPLGHRASLANWPEFVPATSNEALFWSGLLAALGAGLASRLPRAGSSALFGATAAAAAWLVLRRALERSAPWETCALLLAVFLAASASASASDALARRARGATAPLVLWCAVTGGALAIALSGSIVYAQFAGTLAALLGAAVVVALLAPDTSFAGGLPGACVIQLAVLCAAASQFSELGRVPALLVALAPTAALAVPDGARRVLAWRIAAALLPLVVALALTFAARPEPSGY